MPYHRNPNFDRLVENLKGMGERTVQFSDLFNPDFMSRNTNYTTFDAFADAASNKPESLSDMAAYLESDGWNEHVKRSTRFGSWVEMRQLAVTENARAVMMKGLK